MMDMLLSMLFLVIFLLVYGLINFVVLNRLSAYFVRRRSKWFYLVLLCGTMSYVCAHMVDSRFPGIISGILNAAASIWMGIVFIAFFVVLGVELIRIIFHVSYRRCGYMSCAIIMVLTVYSLITGSRVIVRTVSISSPKITKPVSLVHLSDIHLGSSVHFIDFLSVYTKHIQRLKPDFICITGDFLDHSYPKPDHVISIMRQWKAPVYFVTGNHEYYKGLHETKKLIQSFPMNMLDGKIVREGEIVIAGIDDTDQVFDIETFLSKQHIASDTFNIFLLHRPVGVKLIQSAGFDLMLAGHLHAGQIWPFGMIAWSIFGYVQGLYDLGSMKLYVSPGSSTWGPPMRLGSKNEITYIKLLPTH